MSGLCKKGLHRVSKWGRTDKGACRACAKNTTLLRTYGLSLMEYEAIYSFQNGKCPICGVKLQLTFNDKSNPELKRAELDHFHNSSEKNKKLLVRGILCGGRFAGCNRKIGRGLDNPVWLLGAHNYVSKCPAKEVLK